MIELTIALLMLALFAWLGMRVADAKNRPLWLGLVLGGAFGIFGLIAMLFVPSKESA